MTTYSGWHADDLQADKALLEKNRWLLLLVADHLKADEDGRGICLRTRKCLRELEEGIRNLVHDHLDAPLASIEQAEDAAKPYDWGQHGRLSR